MRLEQATNLTGNFFFEFIQSFLEQPWITHVEHVPKIGRNLDGCCAEWF
jgi:hypothetical protein